MLRALIFNNNMAGPISQRNDLTDEHKWDQWREHFVSANDWIKDAEGNATLDLSYLKRNFKDFATFATALRLLQNWAMDSEEGAEGKAFGDAPELRYVGGRKEEGNRDS